MTDIQATRIVQYISVFKEMTPCLDMLKLSIAKSETELDIVSSQVENDTHNSPKYIQKHFEQGLRDRKSVV